MSILTPEVHRARRLHTEVGDWPDFITKYIDELDRSL